MSRAPCTACDSHTKPCTQRPSASSMLPRPSGGGISARKLPTSRCGSSQTSTSMARAPPSPLATRTSPGLGGTVPGSSNRRYRGAVSVVAVSRAPRSVSCPFSGRPDRWAPTAAMASVGSVAGPRAGHSGAGSSIRRRPSAASAASCAAGAIRVMPKGRPRAVRPQGRASAHQPSRFTKLVYAPSRALTPTGSASSSSKVGWPGAVGTTSTSMSCHMACTRLRSAASRYCAWKACVAVMPSARPMTWRTVASSACGSRASRACTTAWRSATQGPSYSSAATSSSTEKSTSTTACPSASRWERAAAQAGG